MNHVRFETTKHAQHPRQRHAQRQRCDLREHPRRGPVHPDAVVNPIGGWLAGRGVRRDDESFVTGAAQMLEDPQHRVADAVDLREEGLRDDRYAHTLRVSAPPVDKVADEHTVCEMYC